MLDARLLANGTLNNNLNTVLHTSPVHTTTRIANLKISNGSTAGTVTISIKDTSKNTTVPILNGYYLGANKPLEITDMFLETTDQILGGITTSADAKFVVWGITETIVTSNEVNYCPMNTVGIEGILNISYTNVYYCSQNPSAI